MFATGSPLFFFFLFFFVVLSNERRRCPERAKRTSIAA